jgi:S-DNA-T family DNA segregation ATPase FtsK/SpoIIIE
MHIMTNPGHGGEYPGGLPAVPDFMPPDLPDDDVPVLDGTVLPAGAAQEALTPALRVRAVITDVARHSATKTATRQVLYVALGGKEAVVRLWNARTTAPYRRQLAAAAKTGDQETALKWAQMIEQSRRNRHIRRVDMISLPFKIAAGLPKVALGFFGVLVAIGVLLAIADHDIQQIATPIRVVANITKIVVVVVSIAWGPLLLAAPWVAVLAFWHVGRTRATMPAWLQTTTDADLDVTIDETTIARALEALRIPQITAYLKEGLALQYITPCRKDGRGTHAVVRLPAGVTAEKIAARRADLATGLYRLAKEVWPTTGSEAGILDLWIADKGVLGEGAGPYPLLDDGVVDLFHGVPFGKILRGDPIGAPILERNTITGGMPGQGKSTAARVIMVGAALDPTAELRIWVPDTNFDFEAFRPRCSRYVMGSEDEHIRQIRDDLVELRAEVQTRGDLLVKYEIPAVTRELANAGVGLHPLVGLLEEAHVAINHPRYGREISGLLVDIVRLGRKRAIHLIVSTQAPTKDSMPRDVTRNCSNGIAFAVGDHVANDALLGQGAYKAGHRATELIPGVDRGTALCKGFSGERSDIIQVYFLDVSAGSDQVTPIIERSLSEIARRGRPLPAAPKRSEAEQRDLLDDLDEVIGAERVRLADLPARLRELAPGWGPYRGLNGAQIAEQLAAEGVRVTRTGNVPRLDPADLRTVINRRSTQDLDE